MSESFAPLYTRVEQELIGSGERLTLEILRGYAWHCDALGLCYPGVQRVASLTHRGIQTVESRLQRLFEMDYIRVHRRYDSIRRREYIDFQISPHVLFIRPDDNKCQYRTEALRLWEVASRDFCNILSQKETEHIQPLPEPESDPESENQNQNQTQTNTTTTYATFKNGESGESENPLLQRKTRQKKLSQNHRNGKQPEGQNQQPEGQALTENTPPVAPPPPLKTFATPLIGDGEELARKLADEFQTRITQARQLIAVHDIPAVEIGMKWITEEQKRKNVSSPFGLLKWWLENSAITPEDKPNVSLAGKYAHHLPNYDDDDGSRYAQGPYADIIQS